MKIRRAGLIALTVISIGLWLTPASGQQQSAPAISVPGEIIVKFRTGVNATRRGALMSARGARVLKDFDEMEMSHVQVGRNVSVASVIAQLRGNPEVDFAQPNFVYQVGGRAPALLAAAGPPNDPLWLDGSLWGLAKISAAQAWSAAGAGNGSVIIADIDSGVQYTHPDLAANIWHNPAEIPGNGVDDDQNGYVDDVFGIDTVNHDSDPMDDHGHGTHTAGTIAAVGNNNLGVAGVNWNAKILACKFANAAGNGSDATAIECLNYIVALKQHQQNIRVTNSSWGAPRGAGPSAALQLAFDNAGNAGILNVAAAGNNGVNTDAQPFDPASFTSSSIVSVAASDQSDVRAGFSNVGAVSVDLAAPGVSIFSTTMGNTYGTMSGTSMAAPHVAGVAALLAWIDPTLSVDNLKVLLMQNTDVLPQWSGLVASGGRLNAFKAVSAIVPSGGGGTSAVFAGVDATTQGNWPNLYGAAGYAIVSDTTSLPAYATVTPSGHSIGIWAASTTDVRALRQASGSSRVAAAWYSNTQFDITVALTDGQPHQVAFYCVDFDSGGRSQRLDVLDATTGALLDTRTVSSFSGGLYVTWTVTGSIRIHLTRLGAKNAVVSGVFIGGGPPPPPPPPPNQPPTVALTSPSPGATFAFGASIPLAANAADPDGTVASVAFYADGQLLNTDTSSPFAFAWPNATSGNHTITAIATDNGNLPTTSAPVAISVSAPSGGASATFTGLDPTTQGNWSNLYGAAGYAIVSDTTSLPAYATVTPSGHTIGIWAASTTDVRALRQASGSSRVAAAWYSNTQFDITVALTDGQPHQVAFYCVDFDSGGRSQRLDVLDATTGALLDTRTVSSFSGGLYVTWTVTGSIRIHLTRLGAKNAVVSGVFIGGGPPPPPPPPPNQPPTVALTSPGPGATFAFGASIPLAANAADPDGTIASVAFYADGQLLNTDTSSPFAFTWTNAASGNHTLTAVATDNGNLPTTSAPVAISVSAPSGGASATFTGLDPTTQGNWSNLYGAAGYAIVSDTTSLPAYATVTPSGHTIGIWAASTTDVRALRQASGSSRVAAAWYSNTQFDITVALTDGQPHQVAFYCVDFDSGGRSQRLDVLDATTGALLDTRTVSSFSGGQYVVWTVTGRVRVHVTSVGLKNAVVSGVFIGSATSSGNQPPAISPSTITLRADSIGTLGAGGNPTSPIAAGSQLLLLKQAGFLYRWTGSAAQEILSVATAPSGIAPIGTEAFLNVAADAAGTTAFVMFTSSIAAAGVPQILSPRPGADAWQVLYRYTFNGTALSNPQAIVSLQVRSDGHTGGGMVVLSDGTVLFATGDNGDAGEDGRQYAQDPTNHLSKILRINPSTSAVTVLASGVRNVQRLVVNPNGGDPRVEFADLGGNIAEEFNSVRVADLLVAPIENFGWGRNAADSRAREGTWYIDAAGAVTGAAPTPEPGFVQPIAQFGREGAQFVAITGTVSSAVSFTNITALFGDLDSGKVLAVIGAPGTPGQTVYRVNLVDTSLAPVTLTGLAGGRPDPRFFLFADGSAGVLLERTGAFYRLTQISQ